MTENIKAQLVNLESTSAFQEEAIHKREKTATTQQLQIQKLEQQLGKLEEHIRNAIPSMTVDPKDDVPPPHY
ncbi:MAG: SlyX family protein [Myxococcota bacterium]|nr:SlyX family protein [Myxococcota bacterium]